MFGKSVGINGIEQALFRPFSKVIFYSNGSFIPFLWKESLKFAVLE